MVLSGVCDESLTSIIYVVTYDMSPYVVVRRQVNRKDPQSLHVQCTYLEKLEKLNVKTRLTYLKLPRFSVELSLSTTLLTRRGLAPYGA